MAKLHELLAVEADLENTAKKILKETEHTFKERGAFFFKQIKSTEMYADDAINPPEEKQEMVTTVAERLDYTLDSFIRYLDAVGQKEKTNQEAKADLVVGDVTIAKDVPATLLLGLESRLKLIRDVYDKIPTLPPGGKWVKDENEGANVYYNEHDEVRIKTAKTWEHRVLVPAQFPKEGEGGQSLPAQIEKWEDTRNVGEIRVKTWSGMISSREKSELLGRLDKVIRAVKRARQRANNTEIADINIGKAIFDYVSG